MSAQGGIWSFDGRPVDRRQLALLGEFTERYGPDGTQCYVDRSIALVHSTFHTTPESHLEHQPHQSVRGFVFTWDGRVDNRSELIYLLGEDAALTSSDVALAALAYERWGTACFRRIVGDWAITVWNPRDRELIFAVDYLAIRHIFYHATEQDIFWSTDLTPLALLSRGNLHVDDNYMAGYFTNDADSSQTPFREICEVPSGRFVRVRAGRISVESYRRFNPNSRVRYKTDADYEHHFRHLFHQSVRRRLRSDTPVLCELSGGLDSTSIVCMADHIRSAQGAKEKPVGTLSYYNNTEPDGDDWVYFRKVEEKRGRVGAHIDTSALVAQAAKLETLEFSALPGSVAARRNIEEERAAVIARGGYRVVLSGLGGDEFMGGIPDPSPQLADLIVRCRFWTLTKEMLSWSLAKRRPWIQLFWQAILQALPSALDPYLGQWTKFEPWIAKEFARRHRLASRRVKLEKRFWFCLPSQKYYLRGLVLMANKMAKRLPPSLALEEARYPYLDQDLIEFVLAIPTSQLIRPGERRSLMRRALAGIVPDEILSRRTKQLAARGPILALETYFETLRRECHSLLSAKRGYIDARAFVEKLEEARAGGKIHLTHMTRTVSLEFWLRALSALNLVADAPGRNSIV